MTPVTLLLVRSSVSRSEDELSSSLTYIIGHTDLAGHYLISLEARGLNELRK